MSNGGIDRREERRLGRFALPEEERASETPSRGDYEALTCFEAARSGNVRALRFLIESDANIDEQEEGTGLTALHYAAGYGVRACLRLLVNSGRCDYLIRDAQDRYPSEVATEVARDYAVGRLLAKKEAEQAHRQRRRAWPKDQSGL